MSTLEAMLSRVKPGNLFAAGIFSQQKGSSYMETPRDDAPANFQVESSVPTPPPPTLIRLVFWQGRKWSLVWSHTSYFHYVAGNPGGAWPCRKIVVRAAQ
jgi:hypothetical protein